MRMFRCRGLLLCASLVLSACQAPPSAPTPAPEATPARAVVTVVAPSPSPIPTDTPAPTPTPTPDPAGLRAEAAKLRFDGETRDAIARLQTAVRAFPAGSDLARDAAFELARAQYETGDPAGAAAALETLIAAEDPAPGSALSWTLLGRAREQLGDPAGAAAAYETALRVSPVISPYLNLWLGNYHLALNEPVSAALRYQAAAEAAPNLSSEFFRRERLAEAYLAAGQIDQALAQWDNIASRARFAAYRARIQWRAAQAALGAGRNPDGLTRARAVMDAYEQRAEAHEALKVLLDAGQTVDDLQRGRVNYHAGSHDAARDAFRRAIQRNDGRGNEIRLWAARNYMALGATDDALRNLDQTLRVASAAVVSETVSLKLSVLAGQRRLAEADGVLRQYQGRTEITRSAINALAAAHDAAGNNSTAIALYQSLGFQPEDDFRPAFRAAVLLRQSNRAAEAEAWMTQALAAAGTPALRARVGFWLGKVQLESGAVITGQRTLQTIVTEAPDSYEGVRAALILSGRSAQATGMQWQLPAANEGQAEAERWLRGWAGISDTLEIRVLPGQVISDVRFARGEALWQLGFEPEALDELGALLNDVADNPIALYALALDFRDRGAYRLSIQAADALMRRAPDPRPSALPLFVARLLHPVYYADLVRRHAEEFDVNPMLIFSVIRQESLFEPFAESSAAASGLMQVIPTTGAEIARELGWPADYSTVALSRPYVSVRYGSYYLAKQKRLFAGNVPAMLAAYNGGPGNALRWQERAGSDPDAFLEAVTFDETRRYLVAITINLAAYIRLYGTRATSP
jgi:soluble lytic murein transglycosylase